MAQIKSSPPLPSTIGKTARLNFPDGSKMAWQVVDEIRRHEDSTKILLLQKLQAVSDPTNEMFRFGYYILGEKPKMKDRWVWGQFAPFICVSDFEAMIHEARKRKWIK